MKSLLVRLLFGMACLSGVSQVHAREARDRPNVIIFFLDDSGYGDYSHTGNPTISTPNISKLAQGGECFTQFYASTAACSASRYALLTGRYPGRSGLGTWVIGPKTKRYIHPNEITIADALKAQGYATAMFGKWHLGTPNPANNYSQEALPLAHGFDKWIGTNVSHDYDNAMLIKSDPLGTTPMKGYTVIAKNLPSNTKASESLTGRYTKGAVEFIKQHKDAPFFLYVAHNQPHLGLYVGDKFKGVSRRGMLGDVMAEIDNSVGQVLDTLKKQGISKNTLIIFSSDNGPWVKFRNTKSHPKYGEARMKVGYAYPFRDGKGSTWEGGHRVPGIFYWPGTIEPTVNQNPASTLDVMPTLMALTGGTLPTDRTLDGRDISPYLLNSEKRVPPFEFLYSYNDNQPSALRVGPWKLHIRINSQLHNNYGFTASVQHPLLFQLEQDLGERIDRAGEYPELVQKIRKKLLSKKAQITEEGSFWDAGKQ